MSRQVRIVMYHYVRDLENSRFPAVKGLSLERFRTQLQYIESRFTPISVEDLFEALASSKRKLPDNSVLLTFDDGYKDHFVNVLPLLTARHIHACFFPVGQSVVEHRILEVNKIQFVLAAVSDTSALLEEVFSIVDEFRSSSQIDTREACVARVTEKHRYDTHEVTVVKRLLQRELPEPVRTEIVRRLFATHVTSDEVSFAHELYMSADEITAMRDHGMHIGNHSYTHAWLNHVSPDAQVAEIDRSLEFLGILGVGREAWTMCYPYGGFNDSLLKLFGKRAMSAGILR